MNKQVFNFHFKTGFLWMLPTFGNWRQMAKDALWVFPMAFLIGIGHKKVLETTPSDIPSILGWWLWCGVLGVMVAATIAGLIYGLVQVVRFRGYIWIDMAPGYRAFKMTREEREFKQYCLRKIPKEKERIIASANLHKDGSIWAVMKPGRHHHGHWVAHEQGGSDRTLQQMGFLTNKFRFLGRQDARKLAMENGQCLDPDHHRDLFSEDLWSTPAHLQQQG